jgi:hypothetical protein
MKAAPNLFLVGGPKCGTTAFVHMLKQHSNIKWASHKEIDYFCKDIKILHKLSKAKNITEYLNKYFNFKKKNYQYIGEGSPFYLYSRVAVKNILRFNPKSKFIVLIRNLVSMSYTLHNMLSFAGQEPESNFMNAWNLQSKRLKSKPEDKLYNKYNELFQYKKICSLGTQLIKIKKIIPKENLLILSYKELQNDYKKVLKKTFIFLNINYQLVDSKKVNKSIIINSEIIKKILSSSFSKNLRDKIVNIFNIKSLVIGRPTKPMDKKIKKFLQNEFKKEIKILKKLKINV